MQYDSVYYDFVQFYSVLFSMFRFDFFLWFSQLIWIQLDLAWCSLIHFIQFDSIYFQLIQLIPIDSMLFNLLHNNSLCSLYNVLVLLNLLKVRLNGPPEIDPDSRMLLFSLQFYKLVVNSSLLNDVWLACSVNFDYCSTLCHAFEITLGRKSIIGLQFAICNLMPSIFCCNVNLKQKFFKLSF